MQRNTLIILAFLLSVCSCQKGNEKSIFQHHTVFTDFPVTSGVRFGTPAIADFDNDGDLDFAMSVTGNELYWFEFEKKYQWKEHIIGKVTGAQLGGTAYDVDADGWTDIIIGRAWFRNSQDPKNTEFYRIEYDTTIQYEIHDIVLADMNGDLRQDLVAMGDKEGCFWYDIPSDPLIHEIWYKNNITPDVLDQHVDIHGGFFPGGVGDIDMDGDADVALPGRWYENEGSGKTWSHRFLPFGSSGYWGLSARSWIIDMDRDGDNDIVMVGCDQLDSRGAWLEKKETGYLGWEVHLLPFSHPGRRGSFHSLWVADFDLDGDPDIFTIEQEDDVILPEGAPIRAYLWENIDGLGKDFRERVVLDGNMGGHDVQFADADGDGDLDAYFKVWANLSTNAFDGKPHVDYLENMTINE